MYQYKNIQRINDLYKIAFVSNVEQQSKLPFYNLCTYKPSKKTLERLRESVYVTLSDIETV